MQEMTMGSFRAADHWRFLMFAAMHAGRDSGPMQSDRQDQPRHGQREQAQDILAAGGDNLAGEHNH